MYKFFALLAALAVTLNSGCAATAVGAGAAGVGAAVDRRSTGSFIDDEIIEVKAIAALGKDGLLWKQSHFNVTSYNGIALLSGETPSETLKARAEQHVASVRKVRHVYNEVVVAAPSSVLSRSSDSYLTAKVKSALLTEKHIRANHVKVVTEAGTVFLMGLLNKDEAERATAVARRVGGVQRVIKLFEYQN